MRYLPRVITATLVVAVVTAMFAAYFASVSHGLRRVDFHFEGDFPLAADEALGFIATPEAVTVRENERSPFRFNLYTDSRSARVNAPGDSTPERVDILTVGGSFSWGHRLENEETFTQILARRFDVPAANLAMGSYGTVQSLQLLERNLDLRPKVVIYGFIDQHLDRNVNPCAPSHAPVCLAVSYVELDSDDRPFIHRPLSRYSAALARRFLDQVVRDDLGLDDIVWGARISWLRLTTADVLETKDDQRLRTAALEFLLERMRLAAASVDATLVLVHIPNLRPGAETQPPPSALVQAQGDGVVLVDLSRAVESHYRAGDEPLILSNSDPHPNEAGHLLIADAVATQLQELGLFTDP